MSSAALEITKPIVLVGLMGCGKSSVGRRLALRLGVDITVDTKANNTHEVVVDDILKALARTK